jgi:hypothetical protein
MKWDWYKQLFSLSCELKEGSAPAKVITDTIRIDPTGSTKSVLDLHKIRFLSQKGGILAYYQGDLLDIPLSINPRIAFDSNFALYFTLSCRPEIVKLLGSAFPVPGNPLCFSHTGLLSENKLLLSISSTPFFNPVPAELKNSLVLIRIDIKSATLPKLLSKVPYGSGFIWKDNSAPQYALRIIK